MHPFQKNKVDMNALSEEERKAFRLYGKLPNRKDVMQNKLKERKYFDSGDYYLSKAGKTDEISPTGVGREHPVPENIPHLSQSPANSMPHPTLNTHVGSPNSGPGGLGGGLAGSGGQGGSAGSPVKEGSFLSRGESIDDIDDEETSGNDASESKQAGEQWMPSSSPQTKREGIPVPVRGRDAAQTTASGLR